MHPYNQLTDGHAVTGTGKEAVPSSPAEMVAEFHAWAYDEQFGGDAATCAELRITLHNEENAELVEALAAESRSWPGGLGYVDWLAHVAKELADVVYIAYGSAYSLGIPLDEVIAIVHRSNMSKGGCDGVPCLRADGKAMKGPHYVSPEPAIARAILNNTVTP